MSFRKIVSIGCDHGGFQLKEALKKALAERGFVCIDEGCFSEDSVDYPDLAKKVCSDVISQKSAFGVLICKTGIGMSIAANKIKGIRAALCLYEDSAKFSRLRNNANVVCLGAKYLNESLAASIVEIFSETEFEGGRHGRRVDKISELEK